MGMYSPIPTPEPRSPRYTHRAYDDRKKTYEKPSEATLRKPINLKKTPGYLGRAWLARDEAYLRAEFIEYNKSSKDYLKFLDICAYTLSRPKDQIRAKLSEMHKRGSIPKRNH